MFLNLQTTYPNGGWMHFKINNGDYIQLSSSDNKIDIYKDTARSGNLDVNVSNTRPSIKAYNTMDGYIAYMESEAKWNSQGYINCESKRPGEHYVFITVKDGLHMYCGNNTKCICIKIHQ